MWEFIRRSDGGVSELMRARLFHVEHAATKILLYFYRAILSPSQLIFMPVYSPVNSA